MIRFAVTALSLLALIGLQHGFLASLPYPLPLLPLTFAAGIYAAQRKLLAEGAWGIAGYGIILDSMRLGAVSLESLSYSVAAIVGFLLARRVFSNRSVYGVVGCAMVSFAALVAVQAAIMAVMGLRAPESIDWRSFIMETGISFALLGAFVVVLFVVATRIGSSVAHGFMLPYHGRR